MGALFKCGDRVTVRLQGNCPKNDKEYNVEGFVATLQPVPNRVSVIFVNRVGSVEHNSLVCAGEVELGCYGPIVLEVDEILVDHDALCNGEKICMSNDLQGPIAEVVCRYHTCHANELDSTYYVKYTDNDCNITKKMRRSHLCIV